MGLLETHQKQIQKLCKIHSVKNLYSFGSVNTAKFNKESDVDLLVDFKAEDPLEYSDHYFDLKFELERILNRPIDLLETRVLKNPIIKGNIDRSKELIYG